MLVECIVEFNDLAEKVKREVGERFEVTMERFAEINRTRYGQLVEAIGEAEPTEAPEEPEAIGESEPTEAPEKPEDDGGQERPWWNDVTRSELVEMAEERGVEVPSKATKAEIAELLEG